MPQNRFATCGNFNCWRRTDDAPASAVRRASRCVASAARQTCLSGVLGLGQENEPDHRDDAAPIKIKKDGVEPPYSHLSSWSFPLALLQPRNGGATSLSLRQVADGKHDVCEDGNPNSFRGDVWNWRESTQDCDNSNYERNNKPPHRRCMECHGRLFPGAVLNKGRTTY